MCSKFTFIKLKMLIFPFMQYKSPKKHFQKLKFHISIGLNWIFGNEQTTKSINVSSHCVISDFCSYTCLNFTILYAETNDECVHHIPWPNSVANKLVLWIFKSITSVKRKFTNKTNKVLCENIASFKYLLVV